MPPTFRVLYVDDEPSLLDITRLYLEKDGFFSVDCVLSGSEALIRIATGHYDAIVADYQMPEMTGIALLQEVRKTDTTVPFILFTGRGREEVVIEAINSGADFYLQKGGDPRAQYAELAHKIRTAAERRAAEKAFKENENRYRSLVDNMHDCVAVYRAVDNGEDFVIIDFNHAAEKTEQVQREAVTGHRVTEVFPGVKEFGILDVFRRVWRTGSPESFPVSLYKDNRISGWRDNFVYKLPSGEIVASYSDETARKQAEEALQKSEEQYRSLVETTGTGYVILDTNGRVLTANQEYLRLCGRSAFADIEGKPVTDWTAPYDIERNAREIEQCLRTGRVRNLEIDYQRPDGTIQPVEINASVTQSGTTQVILTLCRDIAERKRVAESVRQNEERYRVVADFTYDWEYWMSPEGKFIYVSPSSERITGYRPEEFLRDPDLLVSITHPDDRHAVIDHISTIKSHCPEYSAMQFRIITKNGGVRWIGHECQPVFNAAGECLGNRGSNRDITANKMAELDLAKKSEELLASYEQLTASEEELKNQFDALAESERTLRLSEERGRTMIEQSPLSIQILSPDGRTVQVNRAFEELWGLTLENLKSYNILKDEQLTRLGIMPYIMRGFAGEAGTIPAIEYDAMGAVGVGEKRWVLGHIYPVRDPAGTIRNVVIVHEDITERKRAIDALRKSEERFRAIFNATFQFTGLMKPDGTLIEANQAAMDFVGVTPDRIIDKPFWEAHWWRGNERRVNELKDAIRRAAGGEFVRYEVELQGAGDTRGIFDFSIKPVRDQDGTVVLLVPEGRDISDRKRAEETILRVNKKLNILNDITRRDLSNQIFILKSYLELVKSSATGHDLILRNLQKIDPIVQSVSDITEFTRDYQDMGESTPKWQNVKLALLFGISHVSLGTIQHSLETENLEIFADSLLEKAFQGLFENTLAHGGPATRVRASYRRDADTVVIIFEDDGAGIPQEMKERIFLREGGGRASVRGLFFVREILDLTGITIRETGEPGKGARFEISVPKGTFRFTDSG
jgi:PAS domain S-box-containing protein